MRWFVREFGAEREQFRRGRGGGSSSASCHSTALATVVTVVVLLLAVRPEEHLPAIRLAVARRLATRPVVAHLPGIHPVAAHLLGIRRVAVAATRLVTAGRKVRPGTDLRVEAMRRPVCQARRHPRNRTP
jgi:hypothetical protein